MQFATKSTRQSPLNRDRRPTETEPWIFTKADGTVVVVEPSDAPPKNGPFVPTVAYKKRMAAQKRANPVNLKSADPVNLKSADPVKLKRADPVNLKRKNTAEPVRREDAAVKRLREADKKENAYLIEALRRMDQTKAEPPKEPKKIDFCPTRLKEILARAQAPRPVAPETSLPAAPIEDTREKWAKYKAARKASV